MTDSICGIHQVAFYRDGSVSENESQEVAMGLIDTASEPSTVLCFGYDGQEDVILNLIGLYGVTADSFVVDNSSHKPLGSIQEVCSNTYRDITGLTNAEVMQMIYVDAGDDAHVELPIWMAEQMVRMPHLQLFLKDWAWTTLEALPIAGSHEHVQRPLQYQ